MRSLFRHRSSRAQLSYFAQALNSQSSSTTSPAGSWTPVGAESRSHTRSVGATWKRIRSSRAACAVEHRAGPLDDLFRLTKDLDRLVISAMTRAISA